MVKKYDIHGTLYHEPPYTEEEILETARRANGGVVAFRSFQQPRPSQDHAKLNTRPAGSLSAIHRDEKQI